MNHMECNTSDLDMAAGPLRFGLAGPSKIMGSGGEYADTLAPEAIDDAFLCREVTTIGCEGCAGPSKRSIGGVYGSALELDAMGFEIDALIKDAAPPRVDGREDGGQKGEGM